MPIFNLTYSWNPRQSIYGANEPFFKIPGFINESYYEIRGILTRNPHCICFFSRILRTIRNNILVMAIKYRGFHMFAIVLNHVRYKPHVRVESIWLPCHFVYDTWKKRNSNHESRWQLMHWMIMRQCTTRIFESTTFSNHKLFYYIVYWAAEGAHRRRCFCNIWKWYGFVQQCNQMLENPKIIQQNGCVPKTGYNFAVGLKSMCRWCDTSVSWISMMIIGQYSLIVINPENMPEF